MFGIKSTVLELLFLCIGIIFGQEHGPGVVKVVVEEGEQAVLPCSPSPKQNLVPKLFDWRKDGHKEVFMYDAGIHYNNGGTGQDEQFRGRVSHFEDQLKHGNASIIIRDTKIADAGNYTCDFPRLQPRQTLHIQLVVRAEAAPQPYIWTLNASEDAVLLQREVPGASLKPTLEWRDGAGNILAAELQVSERGDRYHVTLFTTVTKTGRYRCVEEIHHKISAETFVSVFEKQCEVSDSHVILGYIGCLFGGALILAAVLAVLVYTKCITIKRNEG